jgi:hypothetical protein
MLALPHYARVNRSLGPGEHALCDVLPGLLKSPALKRIAPKVPSRRALAEKARVLIHGPRGFAFVDVETRRIVISERYYTTGSDLDLYLDLLHELTHLRQLDEGFDLWDERFEYVERPTEVEAYAVAVAEGRRLGMSQDEVQQHLENPWMSEADVERLMTAVETFLSGGPLPNVEAAKTGAAFRAWRPWDLTPGR